MMNTVKKFPCDDPQNLGQNLRLYSIFDKKTNLFMPPFFAKTDDEATRNVTSIVNFSNSLVCKFPKDYELYFMGEFTENTGKIFPAEFITKICDCDALKTDESLQYNTLLNEVNAQKVQLSNMISDYQKTHEKYVNEMALLKAQKTVGSVELYEPKKEPSNNKKNILNKLFK